MDILPCKPQNAFFGQKMHKKARNHAGFSMVAPQQIPIHIVKPELSTEKGVMKNHMTPFIYTAAAYTAAALNQW